MISSFRECSGNIRQALFPSEQAGAALGLELLYLLCAPRKGTSAVVLDLDDVDTSCCWVEFAIPTHAQLLVLIFRTALSRQPKYKC
jgi:hypothetical protein